MIFIIGGRGVGKTLKLLEMAKRDPNSLIVYPGPEMLGIHKGSFDRAVTAGHLLQCLSTNQALDWFDYAKDFNLYFEEPSLYWNTFLQILALMPKDKLMAAAYTPNTKPQSTLEQINPCLVTKILRMHWEDIPKCPNC